MRSQLAVLSLTLLMACGGPLGPVSGGALSGELKPVPVDWAFVNAFEQVQLETNPGDPHSVNTWIGGANGALYLPTSMILGPNVPSERAWVQNVQADDRVRLRIDGSVYELRALRVEGASEYATARAALEKKYALGPDDMDAEREIWIFRLTPR